MTSSPPHPVPEPLLAGGSFELGHRHEDGVRLASLLWRPGPGWRAISSAMVGGGIGPVEWVLNAQVPGGYARMDPVDHLREMAPPGPGVGMLTAAAVDRFTRAADGGAEAAATVGLRVPTWAAAPEGVPDPELAPLYRPGTINILVAVPVPVSDAALVNLVMTVTEAKTRPWSRRASAAPAPPPTRSASPYPRPGPVTAPESCSAAPAPSGAPAPPAPCTGPYGEAPATGRGVTGRAHEVREFREVACRRRRDSPYSDG